MSTTLSQSLEVIAEPLIPELLTKKAKNTLIQFVPHLPEVLQGGFECRLRKDANQVDIQQHIAVKTPELNELLGFVSHQLQKKDQSKGLFRLHSFLSELNLNESLLNKQISEIWLEFDVEKNIDDTPLPAIFFGLPQEASKLDKAIEATKQSLNLILESGGWDYAHEALDQCFSSCFGEIFVSHVGAMLSRDTEALRVNVKRIKPNAFATYLESIGWQEGITEALNVMQWLSKYAEKITVCFDIGEQIYPTIGFECIFDKQPKDESHWRLFIDELIDHKLCDETKGEALLNWHGQTIPINTSANWSEKLIAESLLKPIDCFSIFDRRISHVKVIWDYKKRLEAKAYLWFQHKWFSVKGE